MKNTLRQICYWILDHGFRLIFAALVIVLLHSVWRLLGTPYEPLPITAWTFKEMWPTLLAIAGYLLLAYFAGKESQL